MEEKAADPTVDNLFGGLSIEGLEESLLTVDVGPDDPEITEVVREVSKDEGGDGDPPKTTEPDTTKTVDPDKPQIKPPELIEVDKLKEETEDQAVAQTKEDNSGEGKKATEEENLSPMYLHAAALQEHGLLPDFDIEELKELKSEEQVLKVNEVIQKNVEAARDELVKAELDTFAEPVKKFYEDLKAGVNFNDLAENVTLEEQFGHIQVKDLEDNKELQESIYSDSLYMKNLSEKRVKQLVQVAKENETLLTDSSDGLKEIQGEIKNERESMRKQALANKTAQEERNKETISSIKEAVSSTKSIIPDIDLTKAEQEQLIKNMTVPVKYADNGQGQKIPVSKVMEFRAKDPIAFEMRLNYFIEKGFFDKDAKFDNITKTAETNATKKLIDKMNQGSPKPKGTPTIKDNKVEKGNEFIFPKL